MYYKEEIINGYWYWKSTPNGDWHPFSTIMLNNKIADLQKEINAIRAMKTDIQLTNLKNLTNP